MKIIDFETIRSLCKKIPCTDYYDWINYALKQKDDFVMPSKTRIGQIDGGYYAIMPCLNQELNVAMVKMIGRHILKPNESRSVMMSDMLLYEADTGMLKAVMDAEYLTTLRTGAAAAQAALLYGKSDFSTIGLIGLGNIMTVCVSVLLSKLKDRRITLKLYKHHGQEQRLYERFREYTNVNFVFCDTYEDTIKKSDVIISGVTRVTENFCDDSFYAEGCTVIPIMTMGFQNCDLFFDKVFTDDIDQIRGFKYFDKFKSLSNSSEVLNGGVAGRENDKERILVYYYGLAIHDLIFASKIYELANEVKDTKYEYCKEKFFI